MHGPPPKPTHLRILQGNPSCRPLNRNEPQPPPVETVDPPDYLSGHSRDEWRRIAPCLRNLRLLTQADVPVLAAYCIAYGRWREAEEALAKFRAEDPVTHGLLVEGRINPLVRISRNAARDCLRYAGEFGLTPAARSRISVGIGPPGPRKFDGLLDG
jgi:P27 family predicted phage terminase small subunit